MRKLGIADKKYLEIVDVGGDLRQLVSQGAATL